MVLAWWVLIFAVHLLQPANRAENSLPCVDMACGRPEPGGIFWQVGERMPVVFRISAIIQKILSEKIYQFRYQLILKPYLGM